MLTRSIVMRSLCLSAAALTLPWPAAAQQQTEDPRLSVARELLGARDAQIIALGAQAISLDARVKELTKALEEEKAKAKSPEAQK